MVYLPVKQEPQYWSDGILYALKETKHLTGLAYCLARDRSSKREKKRQGLRSTESKGQTRVLLLIPNSALRSLPSTEALGGCILVLSGCCNKIPDWYFLKHQVFIPPSSGSWKSKIQVPADSTSGFDRPPSVFYPGNENESTGVPFLVRRKLNYLIIST